MAGLLDILNAEQVRIFEPSFARRREMAARSLLQTVIAACYTLPLTIVSYITVNFCSNTDSMISSFRPIYTRL
ncbi:MAG: hypothetical protein LBS55_05830 [Prevotellaceae bacterium]|nr:hypothetical protein [Prevotellaceae bacterium]